MCYQGMHNVYRILKNRVQHPTTVHNFEIDRIPLPQCNMINILSLLRYTHDRRLDILPYTFLIFFYKTLFQEEKKKKRTMGYSKLKIPLA